MPEASPSKPTLPPIVKTLAVALVLGGVFFAGTQITIEVAPDAIEAPLRTAAIDSPALRALCSPPLAPNAPIALSQVRVRNIAARRKFIGEAGEGRASFELIQANGTRCQGDLAFDFRHRGMRGNDRHVIGNFRRKSAK